MNRPQANIAILAAAATAGAPGGVAQALTQIALPPPRSAGGKPLTDALYASVDAVKLGRALRLPDQEFVTFAQTVGYARM